MKYFYLFSVLLLSIFCSSAANVTIPDAAFKEYLLANTSINTDTDKLEISAAEAEAFTGEIFISNSSVANLDGIEAFINITSLKCKGTNITSLDLSKNIQLTSLFCTQNSELSSLNVAGNIKLRTLDCYANNLSSLNVSTLVELIDLGCSSNVLRSLDISKNTKLESLSCGLNQISGLLDLSENKSLTVLKCSFNKISSINFGTNVGYTKIDCYNNLLTNLDVSKFINLSFLDCRTQCNIPYNYFCSSPIKSVCVHNLVYANFNPDFKRNTNTIWTEACVSPEKINNSTTVLWDIQNQFTYHYGDITIDSSKVVQFNIENLPIGAKYKITKKEAQPFYFVSPCGTQYYYFARPVFNNIQEDSGFVSSTFNLQVRINPLQMPYMGYKCEPHLYENTGLKSASFVITITETNNNVSTYEIFLDANSVKTITGINDELLSKSGANFYPNPAKTEVYFSGKAELYDMMGNKVASGEDKLNVEYLNSGVYQLRVTDKNNVTTVNKLLKN